MSREALITDAAIATLAAEGMRGLTHRAVDRAAGLPQGSTSYYFRTRAALLNATVDRLAQVDTADLPPPTADLDTFVRTLAARLHQWATRDRTRQLARYELALEATRRPELRRALAAGDAAVRALVADQLAALGVATPGASAHVLVACIDGLLLDQTLGAGERGLEIAELETIMRRLIVAVGAEGIEPPASSL